MGILNEEPESNKNCSKFKYDPKKKVYDNEQEYNCALKYWEDAVSLHKAYLFQKTNCNWKEDIKSRVEVLNKYGGNYTFEKLYKNLIRNYKTTPGNIIKGESLGTDYNILSRNSNPESNDPMDAKYGDFKILNYYKSLKFNFPIAIGEYSSPDLVHKYLKPQGAYYDGIARSPYYADPGEKPTLQTSTPIKPIEPIKTPENIKNTNPDFTPEKKVVQSQPPRTNPITNFSVSWREDTPSGEVFQNTHYFPNYNEWKEFVTQYPHFSSKNENGSKTEAQALYSGLHADISKDKTVKGPR